MKKQKLFEKRPNYYYGQLLTAEDFLAEQNFHVNGRRLHNLKLHGSGIVSGLTVSSVNQASIIVQPGNAVDDSGQEIILESAEEFDLSTEFSANESIYISISYYDESKQSKTSNNQIGIFAVLTAAKEKEDVDGVLLAVVQLDAQGRIGKDAIDYSRTKYAGKLLVPGIVGAQELAPELKTGWLRLSPHLYGLVHAPDKETEIPPQFRNGPTETVSPKAEVNESKTDLGAAGFMPIPLPPSAKKLLRFRIAGSRNEDKITIRLLRGGWNKDKMEHDSKTLLEDTFSGVPFLKEYPIDDGELDPEFSTLSLWLRCTKRAAVSLIAVELSY